MPDRSSEAAFISPATGVTLNTHTHMQISWYPLHKQRKEKKKKEPIRYIRSHHNDDHQHYFQTRLPTSPLCPHHARTRPNIKLNPSRPALAPAPTTPTLVYAARVHHRAAKILDHKRRRLGIGEDHARRKRVQAECVGEIPVQRAGGQWVGAEMRLG